VTADVTPLLAGRLPTLPFRTRRADAEPERKAKVGQLIFSFAGQTFSSRLFHFRRRAGAGQDDSCGPPPSREQVER
jgi:hypothetical protein